MLDIKQGLFPLITSWVSVIGFDFFLHGGLLATLYTYQSPFLLSADLAVKRIPLGYLSFLILCFLLFWLARLTGVRTKQEGFLFGLKIGLLTWGAFVLGLYSISTAAPGLLLGWWIGQAFELAIAGFVIGAWIENIGRKKIVLGVAGFLALMVILTLFLQIIGFARPMKVI